MPKSALFVTNRVGTPEAELARAVLEHVKWGLNDTGELVFSMKQIDPLVTKPLLLRNEIQLWIDGYPIAGPAWVGVPWKCRNNPSQATFTCYGVLSYLWKRFISNATQTFTSVDQFAIAQGLMTYAQTGTNKTLNITNASQTASGVTRSRTYKRDDHANILDLLKEFPKLSRDDTGAKNGFDFDVDHTNNARVFTCYYPQRGSLKANLTIELGRNMTDCVVDEDATGLATKAYCTGGSNGDVKFENNFEDTAASAVYGEMQHFFSDGSQKDVTVLKQRAADYVRSNKAPQVLPDVQAAEVPVSLLGRIQPGDSVPVVIQKGRMAVASSRRIASITWKPRPNTLTLAFLET